MTNIAAFIETGKKARDTKDRDATLQFGYHAFYALDEIGELRDLCRSLTETSDRTAMAVLLGRIRELVGE